MGESLVVGATIHGRGYVTKASVLRMKSPDRLEQELGYQPGRLSGGWHLLFLLSLPTADQFEYRGYTNMSGGVSMGQLANPPDPRNAEQRLAGDGFDLAALKARTLADTFRVQGADRLAKVVPTNPGNLYPPGLGQPQWEITALLPFKVAAFVGPGGAYTGNYL